MANHVTTEWEDIQVKLGNYVPTINLGPSNDELQEKAIDALEKINPLEKKTDQEIKDLLEDDDEDEELKKYQEKRLKEMKEFAAKPHFGKVYELKRQDYIREVNNAPKDVYVVLHLYQDYLEDSNVLDKIFDALAKRFVLVKFMRIKATSCIEGIKDKDVPALIIYKNSKLIKQYIPANYYIGGKGNIKYDKVEWLLASLKVVKSDIETNPYEEDLEEYKIKKKHRIDDENRSDSDEEDNPYRKKNKEYGWNFVGK